jgi:phage terminase small subunit
MTEKLPRPPANLGKAGRSFWRQIVAAYDASPAELAQLAMACVTLDEIEALEAALRDQPIVATGPRGGLRVHPAVVALRNHRLAFGRIMAALSLPDPSTGEIDAGTARSVLGSQLARARWNKQRFEVSDETA